MEGAVPNGVRCAILNLQDVTCTIFLLIAAPCRTTWCRELLRFFESLKVETGASAIEHRLASFFRSYFRGSSWVLI